MKEIVKELSEYEISYIKGIAFISSESSEIEFYGIINGQMIQSNDMFEEDLVDSTIIDNFYDDLSETIRSSIKYNSDKLNIVIFDDNGEVSFNYEQPNCRTHFIRENWKKSIEEDPIFQKVEQLYKLNSKRKEYLLKNGIKDAFLYGPHYPAEYYKMNNYGIMFLNEGTYSKDGNYRKGINFLDRKTLNSWDDINPKTKMPNYTVDTVFTINYFIHDFIKTGNYPSAEDIKKFKNQTYSNSPEYIEKVDIDKREKMDKSIYCNLRNSIVSERIENENYLKEAYEKKENIEYMLDFIKIIRPNLIIIGSECCTDIIVKNIFPDLNGRLIFNREPFPYNDILFVSIPHPSKLNSHEKVAEIINKIGHAINKNLSNQQRGNV